MRNEGLLIFSALALYYFLSRKSNDDSTNTYFVGDFYDLTQPDITMNNQNRLAFLSLIRQSEGTDQYENPYMIIFGGAEISPADYRDHPGNLGFTDWAHFNSNGKDTYSTASGAYQFLLGTWNRLKSKLQLPDFSPASQDEAALELIREHGALDLIDTGDILGAIDRVNVVWASLPGSPYGQPTHNLEWALNTYNNALQS